MSICNVKKAELNKRKIKNFEAWNAKDNTIYIGRNMSFYVKGTSKSKWANPFSVKKYGRKGCLEKYKEYITNNKILMNSLKELVGKELGCWCYPQPCHGDILLKLLNENLKKKYKSKKQKYVNKFNINKCSHIDLKTIRGIGNKKAGSIIKNRPYNSFDQVEKLSCINGNNINEIMKYAYI